MVGPRLNKPHCDRLSRSLYAIEMVCSDKPQSDVAASGPAQPKLSPKQSVNGIAELLKMLMQSGVAWVSRGVVSNGGGNERRRATPAAVHGANH